MTLRTSITVTGDTAGAQKAVNDLSAGMERAGAAAKGLAQAERIAEAATESLEAELRQARAALDGTVAEMTQLREAAAIAAGRIDVLETRLAKAAATGRANVRSMGEQAMGARMLGQQFQDMGIMVSMSGFTAESALRAFSMQAGQTALAVEQMGVKGAIGRFAAFMGTPWGSIMLTAAVVLAPLAAKLFETGEAAKLAEEGTSQLGAAQSVMADLFGKASSKIAEQNALLKLNAQLKAINLRADAQEKIKSSTETFLNAGKQSWSDIFSPNAEGFGGTRGARQSADALRGIVRTLQNGTRTREQALAESEKLNFDGLKVTKEQFQQAIIDAATADLNMDLAARIDKSLRDGKPAAGLEKPGGRARKPKSTASRDEFGRDAADRIASITEAFDDTPAAVRQADRAIRQLDDLIDDLGRKKPPNFGALIASAEEAKSVVQGGLLRSLSDAFKAPETLADKAAPALKAIDDVVAKIGGAKPAGFEKMIADAQAARGVIEDGIARPYSDFLRDQEQSLQILELQTKGRWDEAEALRTIAQLERSMGPLREGQKESVLATVQGLRAQQRELDLLRQDSQKYLDALGGIEDVVRAGTQAFVRGDLGQLIKSPGKLLDAFQTLQGQQIFDKLFAGVFRDLQDQINGTSVVKDASSRMAEAVNGVTAATGRTTGALDRLASSAERAAGGLEGGGGGAIGAGIAASGAKVAEQVGSSAVKAIREALGGEEIVVEGRKPQTRSTAELFADAIGATSTKILKAFTDPEAAKNIGSSIGRFAGKGLEGAATGSLVAGLGNALGIKLNSTGAQLGGAIGNMLPIPGGSIIGSLAGGLLGGLFTPKVRPGGATVSNVNGSAGMSGTVGSDSGGIKVGSGLAGSIASGINQIVEQLGGALGNFSVQIGTYKDSLRVNQNGRALGGVKGSGAKDFGDDQQAAVSYAIGLAIAQGAVAGLSAKVQQALRSSSDVDKALKEALKVSDIEDMLGGIPADLAKAFKSFEAEAKDRLRIARQYGFDVVEIEKINAKERLDLTKQLTEAQVGSLQKLVDEMTVGSLFEGSAVDQRTGLLAKIDSAQADLDQGVEGAADRLAGLFEQLNSVSAAVYGTTGGFAVDRAAILDQARAAIAKANADVAAAQAKASDPALAATNAALDENNDQNARMIDALERSTRLLEKIWSGGSTSSAALAALARTS